MNDASYTVLEVTRPCWELGAETGDLVIYAGGMGWSKVYLIRHLDSGETHVREIEAPDVFGTAIEHHWRPRGNDPCQRPAELWQDLRPVTGAPVPVADMEAALMELAQPATVREPSAAEVLENARSLEGGTP